MPQVKAALYEIFGVVGLIAATLAMLKAFGISIPFLPGGSIQDWAMVAVACAAGKMAR
jgi:hypothetical protein